MPTRKDTHMKTLAFTNVALPYGPADDETSTTRNSREGAPSRDSSSRTRSVNTLGFDHARGLETKAGGHPSALRAANTRSGPLWLLSHRARIIQPYPPLTLIYSSSAAMQARFGRHQPMCTPWRRNAQSTHWSRLLTQLNICPSFQLNSSLV